MLNSDCFCCNISYINGICVNFGLLSTKNYLFEMQILQYIAVLILFALSFYYASFIASMQLVEILPELKNKAASVCSICMLNGNKSTW